MKKTSHQCNTDLLNRFFDHELDPDEQARFSRHVKECPSCQEALKDNQSISDLFKACVDEKIFRADLDNLEEGVLDLIGQKKYSLWLRLKDLFRPRKFLIPAAAIITMLVLSFSIIRQHGPIPGPSAIINSFEGNGSYVMLLETPKSHQTVIWFNETF
ncbi:MAG TPA: hypothetical protein DDW42_00780 [Desulfobacteraceae bacterium]|nr:hypothetical protein [Desulfobacteraceae bacterium]